MHISYIPNNQLDESTQVYSMVDLIFLSGMLMHETIGIRIKDVFLKDKLRKVLSDGDEANEKDIMPEIQPISKSANYKLFNMEKINKIYDNSETNVFLFIRTALSPPDLNLIEDLRLAICNDCPSISLISNESDTIEWLNSLIITPNFYDELSPDQKNKFQSSYAMKSLVIQTNDLRSKGYDELSGDEKKEIRSLNRYIMEKIYWGKSPKLPKTSDVVAFTLEDSYGEDYLPIPILLSPEARKVLAGQINYVLYNIPQLVGISCRNQHIFVGFHSYTELKLKDIPKRFTGYKSYDEIREAGILKYCNNLLDQKLPDREIIDKVHRFARFRDKNKSERLVQKTKKMSSDEFAENDKRLHK